MSGRDLESSPPHVHKTDFFDSMDTIDEPRSDVRPILCNDDKGNMDLFTRDRSQTP